MVKRRRLQKRRYIAALIITIIIFAMGFLAGLVLDAERTEYLTEQSNQQRVQYSSLQLQYQLIEEITRDGDCLAMRNTFDQNVKNLEEARIRLESYSQDTTTQRENYDLLAREYTHAQIRYYLLAQNIQRLCGEEVSSILYFYTDGEDCSQCDDQAFILTYLKQLIGDKLLVFSFNSQLAAEEPTIQLLMNRYQVNTYPTIVVNEAVYEGLQSKEEILDDLCMWYSREYDFCE